MNPNEIIQHTRRVLRLNKKPWKDLPDELILLAYIPKGCTLLEDFQNEMFEKYNHFDNDKFEFYGDRVLDLATTQLLFENKNFQSAHEYTKFKEELVKNKTLIWLMEKYNLDNCIITDHFKPKMCADAFEALVGILYYHIYEAKQECAIDKIIEWLIEIFDFDHLINTLFTAYITTDIIPKFSC
jgi:hypothetical protein